MPAYALFDNVAVTDPDGLAEYVDRVHETVRAHGGRYLVVGGETRSVEGGARLVHPVLLEFPTLRHAQDWYDSAAYAPLKELRRGATRSTAVFFEGAPSALVDPAPTAWRPTPVAALLILNYDVDDAAGLERYRDAAAAVLLGPGAAELVTSTARTEHLPEAPRGGTHTVVLRFGDVAAARAVYESGAYQHLLADRLRAVRPRTAMLVPVES